MKTISNEHEKVIIQNKDHFKKGNNSCYYLDDHKRKFYKLWKELPESYDFLFSEYYNTLVAHGHVPGIIAGGELSSQIQVKGDYYKYALVYEKVDFSQFNGKIIKYVVSQWYKIWIQNLHLFFRILHIGGYVFFDFDWRNFGINKKNNKLIIFDIDSSVKLESPMEKRKGGNQDFHRMFHILANRYGEKTLRFFNFAALAEIYIATVFAIAENDYKVLEKNRYNTLINYDPGNSKVRLPKEIKIHIKKKNIIEEYLNKIIAICSEPFKLGALNKFSDLRLNEIYKLTEKVINDLFF